MEKAEFHPVFVLGQPLRRGWLAGLAHALIVLLQFFQNNVGTLHDTARHTGDFSHMYTETVLRAAAFQFAQEDHLAVDLLHAHVVVFDAWKILFHLVELVIVSGEERASLCLGILVQILHNGPCDADAVVGTGAASKFIEEDERVWGDVVEDVSCLGHFHHKRGLAQ